MVYNIGLMVRFKEIKVRVWISSLILVYGVVFSANEDDLSSKEQRLLKEGSANLGLSKSQEGQNTKPGAQSIASEEVASEKTEKTKVGETTEIATPETGTTAEATKSEGTKPTEAAASVSADELDLKPGKVVVDSELSNDGESVIKTEDATILGENIFGDEDFAEGEENQAPELELPKDSIPINAVSKSDAEERREELQRIGALKERELEISREKIALSNRLQEARDIDMKNQLLKEEALLVSREIKLLEDKILFPIGSEVAIFFAVENLPNDMDLDSVTVKIDNKIVNSHLYSDKETGSLLKGAIQRIYNGGLVSGNHILEILVRYLDESNQLSEVSFAYRFDKGSSPKFIELRLDDESVSSREW